MTAKPKRSNASRMVADEAFNGFSATFNAQFDKGILKYGTALHTFNGRDAHADALAELVDAVQYLTQARMEREEIVKAAKAVANELRRCRTLLFREYLKPEVQTNGEIGSALDTAFDALAAWDALGLGAGEGE